MATNAFERSEGKHLKGEILYITEQIGRTNYEGIKTETQIQWFFNPIQTTIILYSIILQ